MNLFRVGDIQLAVHASFLVLPPLAALEGWSEGGGWEGALLALGLLAAFFVCVVLHEFGHALAALRLGIRVPRILLLPIGGMAEFERIPRRPADELFIAIAGPLVNVLIVALLLPFVTFPESWEEDPAWFGTNGFVLSLLIANAVMAVFNLLPVFPMDGGRVLRALLALRLPYLRATFLAATIAKVLAVGLIGLALWAGLWLAAVLFVFVIIVGEAEYRTVRRMTLWEG